MKHPAAVIDTNVVVTGLITADAGSPTARILDGMRRGGFPSLLSDQLLAEYREVLLRAKIRKLHGLPKSALVTGDRALAKSPPPKSAVFQPREFAGLMQK